MATTTPIDVTIRSMVAADATTVASAFAAIGWTSKSIELFAGYLHDQDAGTRQIHVAFAALEFAGYVTVNWAPRYAPFAEAKIPEIQDLNVLPSFRRRGIASLLLQRCEELVALQTGQVGIAVGLHPGYNAAQRMYVRRGYVPDARGVTAGGEFVQEGQTVTIDDELVLHLVKVL